MNRLPFIHLYLLLCVGVDIISIHSSSEIKGKILLGLLLSPHHLFAGCVYFNCIPANNYCMTILLFRERVSLSLSRPPSQYVPIPLSLSLSLWCARNRKTALPSTSIQSTLTEFSVTHFYIQTETTDNKSHMTGITISTSSSVVSSIFS